MTRPTEGKQTGTGSGKDGAAVRVKLKALPHARGLPRPTYQTVDAAGLDLVAAVPSKAAITIAPGGRALIPTGLQFALPPGTEAQVRPRSGLAIKHGVTVLNSPGTIDADYRGEVQVILINHGNEPFVVARGDRIAQLVIAHLVRADLKVVSGLDDTVRGAGGFGSTGHRAAPKPLASGARPNPKKKNATVPKLKARGRKKAKPAAKPQRTPQPRPKRK